MRKRSARVIKRRKQRWPGGLYLTVGVAVATGGALLASAIYSWLGWMAFFTAMAFRLMSDDAPKFWLVAIGLFSGGCSGVIAGFTTWLGLQRVVAYPRRLFVRTWLVWTVVGATFWLFERGLVGDTALLLGVGVAARAFIIAVAAWVRHAYDS